MKRILYVGNKLKEFGFTPTGVEFIGDLLSKAGYQVLTAGNKKNKFIRLLSMLYYTYVYRNKYDVLFIDIYSTKAFYFGVAVTRFAKWLGKPYIPVLHGGDLPRRMKISPGLMKFLIDHAHKVVAVSRYIQEAFAPMRETVYIPNYIKLEDYSYLDRTIDFPRLLWVRSLSRIYNPALAIELVGKLVEEKYDANLLLIGPDKENMRLELESLSQKLKVSNRVRFLGKMTRQEWTSLASGQNIFINTTNIDNMPVSVVEAMALGLPVVSTDVGGVPFLIIDRQDGLLVPPGNPIAFREAIKELVHNPQLARKLAYNARLKVKSFDESNVLKQWVQLLVGIDGSDPF